MSAKENWWNWTLGCVFRCYRVRRWQQYFEWKSEHIVGGEIENQTNMCGVWKELWGRRKKESNCVPQIPLHHVPFCSMSNNLLRTNNSRYRSLWGATPTHAVHYSAQACKRKAAAEPAWNYDTLTELGTCKCALLRLAKWGHPHTAASGDWRKKNTLLETSFLDVSIRTAQKI